MTLATATARGRRTRPSRGCTSRSPTPIDVSIRARPVAGQLVSGDFWDVFAVDECTWAVLLGDAIGSGAAAAPLAALAHRAILATAAADGGCSPAAALRHANRALLDHGHHDAPLTSAVLAYGRSVNAGLDVAIASAGHVPGLIVRADRVETAPVGGPLLGIFDDVAIGSVSIRLARGDALVLYTDGVTEARNQIGEMLGDTGLTESLIRNWGRPAATVTAAVERTALHHGGAAPHHDMAVIAITAPRSGS